MYVRLPSHLFMEGSYSGSVSVCEAFTISSYICGKLCQCKLTFLITKKTKSFTLQIEEVSSKWSYITVMSNEKYVYPRFYLN